MPPPRAVSAEKKQQSPEELAGLIREYFEANAEAAVLEDGKVVFDMRSAQYELKADAARCTLQLWSEERNLARRVIGAESRGGALRLATLRLGHKQTKLLELVAGKERRTPSVKEGARVRFLALLERALRREFPEWKAEGFRTSMDLQHSFGPAYARGLLVRGQRALAVIAVNETESAAVVDAILTPGVLWLDHCRENSGGRKLVEGLLVVVPRGTAGLTASRMAWMNSDAAAWRVFELLERDEELVEVEPDGGGNLRTRLVHHADQPGVRERFAEAAAVVMQLVPAGEEHRVEQRLRDAAELAFLLHGMQFACARVVVSETNFARTMQVTVGAGEHETPLVPENQAQLRDVVEDLFARRNAEASGGTRDPLFRAQPERWLESVLRADLAPLTRHLGPERSSGRSGGVREDAESRVIPRFDPQHVYAQVPAIAGAKDRGMLDLLGVTADGRLAVIELKADEDPELALQGLDYWIRVRHHHAQRTADGRSALQRHGYFAGVELSEADPRLYLVASALRIHPAVEVVLRYVSPRVEWHLLALDERWRSQVRVVWRKSR